jgi:DNA-directed RNA polymerase I subunit RPA1
MQTSCYTGIKLILGNTETTVGFLKDAVLDGDWDSLATPSSRLVVGKLGTVGTGSFDVLTRVPTEHRVSAF